MDPYENIDPNIFTEILIHIPRNELELFFNISKRIKSVTYNNESFWKDKIEYDYPDNTKKDNISWKEHYVRCSGNVYIFHKHDKDYVTGKSKQSLKQNYINKVSCGNNHIALVIDNELYLSGNNGHGQLGVGHTYSLKMLSKNRKLNNVTNVECGYEHTMIISDGKLYGFGFNNHGQLGILKIYKNVLSPYIVEHYYDEFNNKKILESTKITKISCGGFHSTFIMDGMLYTFGSNIYNQLIHTNKTPVCAPIAVPNFKNVTTVSCGKYHTAIIDNNKLHLFGNNSYGQLGNSNKKESLNQCLVKDLENITQIACGGYHTAVIANKRLYTFGSNKYGQLVHNVTNDTNIPTLVENLENVTYVACSENLTMVIANGKLYGFGKKKVYNKINVTDNIVEIACGSRYISIIDS
jgi:alpha-tubulin suppressor-like RCC1 family protein